MGLLFIYLFIYFYSSKSHFVISLLIITISSTVPIKMYVMVYGHLGMWPLWFVAVLVCGRFGLWPLWLWPFRFMAVLTRNSSYSATPTKLPPWHRRFIGLVKREIPGVIAIHCLIQRHHIAAKHVSGELHDTLDFTIKCINRIKAKSLNDRLFRILCQDNDEDSERLLLHTEVRWLSK